MDARLRWTERLTRQADIDAVYKTGRRFHAKFFRIHVKPNTLPFSRFTVSVPKRVCIAVLRNRWKRLLRESFRLGKEKIGPGPDIAAVPPTPPTQLPTPPLTFALPATPTTHPPPPSNPV